MNTILVYVDLIAYKEQVHFDEVIKTSNITMYRATAFINNSLYKINCALLLHIKLHIINKPILKCLTIISYTGSNIASSATPLDSTKRYVKHTR